MLTALNRASGINMRPTLIGTDYQDSGAAPLAGNGMVVMLPEFARTIVSAVATEISSPFLIIGRGGLCFGKTYDYVGRLSIGSNNMGEMIFEAVGYKDDPSRLNSFARIEALNHLVVPLIGEYVSSVYFTEINSVQRR